MNAYFYPLTILLLDRIISNKSKGYSCGLGAKREACSYRATAMTWEAECRLRDIRLRYEVENKQRVRFFWYLIFQCFSIKCGEKTRTDRSNSTPWPGQYVRNLKPQRNLAVAPRSGCLPMFSHSRAFLNFHVCLFWSMQMTAARSCAFTLSSCLP